MHYHYYIKYEEFEDTKGAIYLVATDRTIWNTSENLCRDLENWHYCFYR